ncbi:MAG: DUF4190 domain-containing protein [Verrucomicrobiota bacterium]|nr:DUF4190 domain-containing protein [Verrucomicrobiota bacterium]
MNRDNYSPSTPKTSGLAVASLIFGLIGVFPIALILSIKSIRQINASDGTIGGKGFAIAGLVTSILGVITALILASMLLPALGNAARTANRFKCINNLKQLGRAHIDFAVDNDEKMPWQLNPAQRLEHFGSALNQGQNLGANLGLTAMKAELQTAKILLSPCDPGRSSANEELELNWQSYDTKAGKPVQKNGVSYAFCLGGDVNKPSTVLALTRNLSKKRLNGARWLGADRDPNDPNTMEGLYDGEGQVSKADGSAGLSRNSDFFRFESDHAGSKANARIIR